MVHSYSSVCLGMYFLANESSCAMSHVFAACEVHRVFSNINTHTHTNIYIHLSELYIYEFILKCSSLSNANFKLVEYNKVNVGTLFEFVMTDHHLINHFYHLNINHLQNIK